MPRAQPSPPWIPIIALAAIGLAVRIAAARGGLWLDEAWSATAAADVATPIGVFVGIHHDNNHHLNSLWLQWVGIAAHPVVQRGLSIVCGTAGIVVAALVLAPRGRIAAVAAAVVFALSPILVTYGSEARGYAPMLLAVLLLVLVVQRWLADGGPRPAPTIGLAVLCLLGTLAQMTMVFGVLAVTGWAAVRRWRDAGLRPALVDTMRLMAAPLCVTAATIWAIVRGLPGAAGLRIGSYQPFRLHDLVVGQSDMLSYALGIPMGQSGAVVALGACIAALALLRPIRERRALYLFAIVGLPIGCVAVSLGNVAIARYFLVGAAALLLLLAEVVAVGVACGGWRRVAAVAAFCAVAAGSIATDATLLDDPRGDPARAIAVMRHRMPAGTTVTLDRERALPVLRVAAAQAAYPLRIDPCGRFLFVDRDGAEPFPARPTRCGHAYAAIADAHPAGLSGTHWTLYERRP